jgi:hypothetical protein
MALLTKPDNQTRGIVSIIYNTSSNPDPTDPYLAWQALNVRHALPLRNVSMHFCMLLKQRLVSLVSLIMQFQPTRARVRTRFHVGAYRSIRLSFWLLKLWRLFSLLKTTSLTPVFFFLIGTDLACQYQLKCFGIVLSSFPVDLNGQMDLGCHRQWIQRRQEIENTASRTQFATVVAAPVPSAVLSQAGLVQVDSLRFDTQPAGMSTSGWNSTTPTFNGANAHSGTGGRSRFEKQAINCLPASNGPQPEPDTSRSMAQYVTPARYDVLFGRGRPIQCHPGNIRFRQLLEVHADEYERVSKFEKTLLAARLVQTVKATGSRFLKQVDGDRWVQVGEVMSHKKVSQSFRTRRGKR